jgi:CheY-like chemotaxis protein
MVVLLVDDDPDDHDLFREALAVAYPNAKCLYADNAFAALSILKGLSELPQYIFLDINMPVMTGKELLPIIRNTYRFKNIKIVMYSTAKAISHPNEQKEATTLGANHFLVKTPNFESLVNALKILIK